MFVSNTFQEAMTSMGVNVQFSHPFKSNTNGLVERCNYTIKQALMAWLLESGLDWIHHLYGVQRALSNLPRGVFRGQTPYQVLFGVPMYVPDLNVSETVMEENPSDAELPRNVLQKKTENSEMHFQIARVLTPSLAKRRFSKPQHSGSQDQGISLEKKVPTKNYMVQHAGCLYRSWD